MTKRKPKKCRVCERDFTPFSTTSVVCSAQCSYEFVKRRNAKKALKKINDQIKYDKMVHRKAKEKLKTKNQWLAEAQIEFNKFIRFRDHDQPCISCGRVKVEMTRGGKWDCGHFVSRGAQPALRFEEINCYKQCKSCNGGSGKYARKNYTVRREYKKRLIIKIGLESVEWLEKDHPPKKYTIADIKEIKTKYRKKWRELEAKLELT